jgi:hypothetical protein
MAADNDLMEELLSRFTTIFAETMSLPLPRDKCHRIHLLHGTMSVAVQPHQYAHS